MGSQVILATHGDEVAMTTDDQGPDPLEHPREGLAAARVLAARLGSRTDSVVNALGDREGEPAHPAFAGLYAEACELDALAVELHEAIEVELDRQLRNL